LADPGGFLFSWSLLLPQTSTMHPGAGDAAVWPIEQQKQLFALLGDVPANRAAAFDEALWATVWHE
jgi:hypothetical protein